MSSIIRDGDTYHGISVFGRGVFTTAKHGGRTYAGQHRDGYACGLGVITYNYDGDQAYAEHGPDGQEHGRYLCRWSNGDTYYRMYERGKAKAYADVYRNGRCYYNGEDCAPDDPRVLALTAQVAPVEVRPAAPAPHPPSARHSPPIVPCRSSRRPLPPRCTPRPHTVAGGRAAQPNNQSQCKRTTTQ